MANDKKYYWLKLKDDFFRDKKMKKLRNIAGGDTYTIIYLKMQLLSLKNRQKSIEYGLVIFIRPEDHNGETHGIHCKNGHEFDEYIKAFAQRQAMKYYGWSISKFREIFGKSYIGE